MNFDVQARNPRRRSSALLLALAVAIAACIALVAPAPAQALGTSYVYSNTGASNVRYSPSTASGTVVRIGNYTRVQMLCWTDAQWAFGNYWTNRWFRIRIDTSGTFAVYNGVRGYVHASLVRSQTSVPRC